LPNEELSKVESFSPTTFFLVLLPPIIFESGYNLHKGNFFANLGSIVIFAIFGTIISALVVGGGVYLMGLADLVYQLDFVESFAFGSLISAVDPVATLAIFQALDVDPVLNMLVFGESILNDAVAIVLTTTVVESSRPEMAAMSNSEQAWHGIQRFVGIFLGSAGIGTVIGLISSLVLKHVDLYYNPSLEFALMLCFLFCIYSICFCGGHSLIRHYGHSLLWNCYESICTLQSFSSYTNYNATNNENLGLCMRILCFRLLRLSHIQLSSPI